MDQVERCVGMVVIIQPKFHRYMLVQGVTCVQVYHFCHKRPYIPSYVRNMVTLVDRISMPYGVNIEGWGQKVQGRTRSQCTNASNEPQM